MREEIWLVIKVHNSVRIECVCDDNGEPYTFSSKEAADQAIDNEINKGAMKAGGKKSMEFYAFMEEQDAIRQRVEEQHRVEDARIKKLKQGFASHEYIKSKGLKNLKEVSIISDQSSKQLCRWYKKHYSLFLVVVDGCLYRKEQHNKKQELKKLKKQLSEED